jgi:hypothetical protein
LLLLSVMTDESMWKLSRDLFAFIYAGKQQQV